METALKFMNRSLRTGTETLTNLMRLVCRGAAANEVSAKIIANEKGCSKICASLAQGRSKAVTAECVS